jgi:anti-anti-sigma factor
LYLVGRLDAECVHHVESALTDARTRGGQVLVDLSRVEFLDCSGLGLLLRARLRNALLRLTAPSPVVRRVFAMALPVSVLDLWEAPP